MADFFTIFPDIHYQFDKVKAFLERERPEKAIFLGDFNDSHKPSVGNGPEQSKETALFLKWVIENRPKDILLNGNHCLALRFPNNPKYQICGNSPEKTEAFYSVFPPEYWEKFVLFHLEEYKGEKILLSHAGVDSRFLPNGQFDYEFLKRIEKVSLEAGNSFEYIPLLDSEFGPLWIRVVKVLDGVSQIFGHTFTKEVKLTLNSSGDFNLAIDTDLEYCVVFTDDGIFSVHMETGERKKIKIPNLK